MKHLLALEAGAGSGRAVLFDEHGNPLAAVGREWTHPEEPGVPGSMNFEREANWQLLVDCIRDVLSQVPDANVAAVTADAMGEGIVLYDENERELWACANVDARAIGQVSRLRQADPGLEHRVYLRSGQTFSLGAAPRILWLKENAPDIYERAAKVAMLSDWVSHRLGAPVMIDPSNGGTAGLFKLATRKLDPELASACGFRSQILSTPVREGGDLIGEVSPQAARETGLRAGTPVVGGGRD